MGRLLNTESPLQVLPVLALKIGLNECLVLQQIHYWLNPEYNKHFYEGRHWVFNGYKEWQQQFPFLSPSTIKRTIHSLEQQNLIFTCQRKQRSLDHRKWYSINYETLEQVERTNYRSYRHHQKEENEIHTDEDLDTPENSLYVVEDIRSSKSEVLVDPIDVNLPSMTDDRGRRSSDVTRDISLENFRLDQNDRSGQNDLALNKVVQSNGSKWAKPYKEQRLQAEITIKTSPLTRVREEVATQLLEIWNKTFGQSLLMTASRGLKLVQGLDRYFAGDIRAWQPFCERVLSSAFLQGQGPRGWRASLDWCLEESNLVKILEGNYCDKTSKATVSPTACESLSKAQSHIETLKAEDHRLAQEVCEHLGPNAYSSWFEGMKVAGRTQDRILLTFPTKFIRNTVDIRYLSALREIIQKLSPGCWLELGVEGDTLAAHATPAVISEKPETAVSEYVNPVARDFPRPEADPDHRPHRPMLAVVKDLARSLVSLESRRLSNLTQQDPEEIAAPTSMPVIDRASVPVTGGANMPIPDGVLKPVTGGASVPVTAHGRVPVVVDDRSIDPKEDSEVTHGCSWDPQTTDIPEREQKTDEELSTNERLDLPKEPLWAEKESPTDAFLKPAEFSVYRMRKLEDISVLGDKSQGESMTASSPFASQGPPSVPQDRPKDMSVPPWDVALHDQRTRACA